MTLHQDTPTRPHAARPVTARRAGGPAGGSAISFDALQAALRAAEPNVLLASPWLLQAIIAYDRGMLPTGLKVPDDQLYTVGRAAIVRYIAEQELPTPGGELPSGPRLVLLERPDPEWLATTPGQQALTRYWRLLVRANAEANVRRAIVGDGPDVDLAAVRAGVARRVAGVGAGIFNEARHVLVRERRLGASDGDFDAYAKFAAAFTDLWHFAPRVIAHVFPSVDDPAAVARAMEADVGAGLVESVRPDGAPDLPGDDGFQPMVAPYARRTWWALARRWLWPASPGGRGPAAVGRVDKAKRESLLAAAGRADARRNDVRAAILTARALRADDGNWRVAPGQAQRAIDGLADRLAAALEFAPGETVEWRTALRSLLGPAAVGWKSPESRLLYDLQKVCDDREREVYSVNVVEWVLERGRRPLVRALPSQRLALAARHLHAAAERLPRCRLSAPQRGRLDRLIHAAIHHADHRLRRTLGPQIASAFESAGMTPRTAVEAVGRDKVLQELLDVILRDGYLTFAGVRDAISRNVLRCEDLTTAGAWVGYDQLMWLDRYLGDALDGVYRRGEVYRYVFQKFSSLLFAWPLGRLLTKTVVLPVVGAYILLAATDHMVVEHIWHHPAHLTDWHYRAPTAVVLALLVNWASFRRAAGRGVAWIFRWISFVLFDVPDRLLRNRVLLAAVASRPVRLAFRYGFKPLTVVLLVWWLLPHDVTPAVQGGSFAAAFLLTNLLLNSRTGRAFEQAVLHALRVGWVRFTADVVGHALRGVLRLFARIVETVDRMLYAVDEWLRFREGQEKPSLVGKAALGVVWFYVAYLARFAITLLVEPQINPIKHFPVVTVSHKLLLPLAIPQRGAPSPLGEIGVRLFGMSHHAADTTAATVVWGIPGIFGFLAWELRSNWKLYRATLPDKLGPIHFGSHGESVAQLLRPGFHSGTLPKAYGKVRRAHRNYDADQAAVDPTEYPLAVRKQLVAIHHVEESVTDFVSRAMLPLVNRHPLFRGTPIELSGVEVGVTRIGLSLGCPAVGAAPVRIEFQQVAGWIVADVADRGWVASLDDPRVTLVRYALRGLYHQAAVDIVRSDVDRALAGLGLGFDVEWELRPKYLVVRRVVAGGPRRATIGAAEVGTKGVLDVAAERSAPAAERLAASAGLAAAGLADAAAPTAAPSTAGGGVPAGGPRPGGDEVEYALYEREMHPRPRGGRCDSTFPVLRPEQVLLRDQPIGWDEWVKTWEADDVPAAGE